MLNALQECQQPFNQKRRSSREVELRLKFCHLFFFFHLDLTGKISMHIFVHHRILRNSEWYGGVEGQGGKEWEFKLR